MRENAVIDYAEIRNDDHNVLTAWIGLDFGGTHQGFGGYALYLPPTFDHHKMNGPAGHFIDRCMRIAGVSKWSEMKGRTVRAERDSLLGPIKGIGHIVNDEWFFPEQDFAKENGR
jgi:hypothetical protein